MFNEIFNKGLRSLAFSSDSFSLTLLQSLRIARSRLPVSAPKTANNIISSTANLGQANSQALKLSVRYDPVTYTITSELMLAMVSPGTGAVQERTSPGLEARLS